MKHKTVYAIIDKEGNALERQTFDGIWLPVLLEHRKVASALRKRYSHIKTKIVAFKLVPVKKALPVKRKK